MQKPEYIKELGSWIWGLIQDVFVFVQKPLGGIFMLLVFTFAAFLYSNYRFDSGYEIGVARQLKSDSARMSENKERITELKIENRILVEKNESLKEPDCLQILKRAEEAKQYIISKANSMVKNNKTKESYLRELNQDIKNKELQIESLTNNP